MAMKTLLTSPIEVPRKGEAKASASASYWKAVEKRAQSSQHRQALQVFERAVAEQASEAAKSK